MNFDLAEIKYQQPLYSDGETYMREISLQLIGQSVRKAREKATTSCQYDIAD